LSRRLGSIQPSLSRRRDTGQRKRHGRNRGKAWRDIDRRGADGPDEGIGIEGDPTFALRLAAQARGHKLSHDEVRHLTLRAGTARPGAVPNLIPVVAGPRRGQLCVGRDCFVVYPGNPGYLPAKRPNGVLIGEISGISGE